MPTTSPVNALTTSLPPRIAKQQQQQQRRQQQRFRQRRLFSRQQQQQQQPSKPVATAATTTAVVNTSTTTTSHQNTAATTTTDDVDSNNNNDFPTTPMEPNLVNNMTTVVASSSSSHPSTTAAIPTITTAATATTSTTTASTNEAAAAAAAAAPSQAVKVISVDPHKDADTAVVDVVVVASSSSSSLPVIIPASSTTATGAAAAATTATTTAMTTTTTTAMTTTTTTTTPASQTAEAAVAAEVEEKAVDCIRATVMNSPLEHTPVLLSKEEIIGRGDDDAAQQEHNTASLPQANTPNQQASTSSLSTKNKQVRFDAAESSAMAAATITTAAAAAATTTTLHEQQQQKQGVPLSSSSSSSNATTTRSKSQKRGMITDKLIKIFTRLLAPDLAKNMERGSSAQFTQFSDEDIANFVEVEDNGSDVTIFTFAGLAVLFAGLPAFEFKRLLRNYSEDYNLVLFRDIRRLCYHVTPEGQPSGLEFFERHVREAMASLGSTYNVGVGVSGGGAAALYFGTRCGFDQVIAFSPGCPITVYCSPWNQLRAFFDLPRLVTSPKAYSEQIYVTLGTAWCYRRLRKIVGKDNIWSVMDTYRNAAENSPSATVYYGRGARPDARQAKLFDGCPNVKRVALPTKFHNCAGFLKDRGELGSTIFDEIHAGLAARDREDAD